MIQSRGWLVCGLLLVSVVMAACAGPMAQDESQPVATPTLAASATPEPTATTTIPNTPTVTPSPSPTATLEPTPEPSSTPPPTETPEPTMAPTPEFDSGESIREKTIEADANGLEIISVRDPYGFDVNVDVVPAEVYEQGEWNWDYRGYVRQGYGGGLEVYRTLQGVGENDQGRWFGIMSEIELPGNGIITFEYDLQEMQSGTVGFEPFRIAHPERWEHIVNGLWGDKHQVIVVEKLNGVSGADVISTRMQNLEIYLLDTAARPAGISFVLRGTNREKLHQSEKVPSGEISFAHDEAVDAGRIGIEFYAKYWKAESLDLANYNIGRMLFSILAYQLQDHGSGNQAVLEYVTSVTSDTHNTWRASRPEDLDSGTLRRLLEELEYNDLDLESTVGSFVE